MILGGIQLSPVSQLAKGKTDFAQACMLCFEKFPLNSEKIFSFMYYAFLSFKLYIFYMIKVK